MNYIVLIKQVPDIKNIPEKAWDWEKGTLKRGLLDSVLNELDKQALAFVLAMKKEQDGKTVSLSMGPSFAAEVLRYALSIGIDHGVLLTDKRLAGADTVATAYSLAQAIRKIEAEIFNGDRNYVIVCGMQSVDGDTAQVPPQIAEELGIAHIAYATTAGSFDNSSLRVERITRRGTETITPDNYPCLVTVTEWTKPLYPSFRRTRWAEAQKLYQWSADDVRAETFRIGLAGSKTRVVKIFSPKEAGQKTCIFEHNLDKLAKMLKEAYNNRVALTPAVAKKEGYRLPEGKQGEYKGAIWVYAEQEGGELNPVSFELLGKASELASALGEKVGAVLVGKDIKGLSRELITYGADYVYVAEHDLLENFLPVPYTKVIAAVVAKYKPQIMLFSATPMGRELAPRVAYRSGSGLTADCTGLDIVDFKRGDKEHIGVLMQTRPALGGNIMASIITQNSKVQMSTARPGILKPLGPDRARTGEVLEYKPDITESDLAAKIVSAEVRQFTFELRDARIIVSGGLGLKTRDSFTKYIHPLADSIGKLLGQKVIVGASRPAVESGFIDRSRQIGQTGQTVKPGLYVAIGISGAVQHISGMQSADIILAINKDPKAGIFKIADFGIVGNLEEVVPKLITALEAQGAG